MNSKVSQTMIAFILLLITTVSAIEVSVNFVDTAIPSQDKSYLVCEALNTLYSGNVTTCFDDDPFDKMNTQLLHINIQTVDVNASSVTINQAADVAFINSYLKNNSYFLYPDISSVSIVYLPVDQKLYAYLIVSTYVLGGMLLLLLLVIELPICCRNQHPEYRRTLNHKIQG